MVMLYSCLPACQGPVGCSVDPATPQSLRTVREVSVTVTEDRQTDRQGFAPGGLCFHSIFFTLCSSYLLFFPSLSLSRSLSCSLSLSL